MRLWTYQPPGFRIGALGLVIDPKLGPYWNEPLTPFYKDALPKLCKMLGLERYPLWCFTVPGCWFPVEYYPVDEWELTVPESEILGFVRMPPWDSIVKGTGDDWTNVIVKERPVTPGKYVSALVSIPLSPGSAKCLGAVKP